MPHLLPGRIRTPTYQRALHPRAHQFSTLHVPQGSLERFEIRVGILTCEILDLELAHLLISDPEIHRVTVVEEKYSPALPAETIVNAANAKLVGNQQDQLG